MKKVFLLATVILFATACRKSSDTPQPLISRFTVNGNIAYKFSYNSDNQITRWELYSYTQVGSPLGAVIELGYGPDKKLAELRSFQFPGNVPLGRAVFEYDADGRVASHESFDLQGADPSKPIGIGTYSYNASGRLTTVSLKDKDGELITRYNFSYYDDGTVKERNAFEETITNQLRLKEKIVYSVAGPIKGWEGFSVIPVDGDDIIRRVRYESHQRYAYNNGVLTKNSSQLMSAREFNTDQTLKRQTATTKNILPASADIVDQYEFEYIQQ